MEGARNHVLSPVQKLWEKGAVRNQPRPSVHPRCLALPSPIWCIGSISSCALPSPAEIPARLLASKSSCAPSKGHHNTFQARLCPPLPLTQAIKWVLTQTRIWHGALLRPLAPPCWHILRLFFSLEDRPREVTRPCAFLSSLVTSLTRKYLPSI